MAERDESCAFPLLWFDFRAKNDKKSIEKSRYVVSKNGFAILVKFLFIYIKTKSYFF